MKVDLSEYTRLENVEQYLELWPWTGWSKDGEYLPEALQEPDHYPCLVKEICVEESSNGKDYAILSILYFTEEE